MLLTVDMVILQVGKNWHFVVGVAQCTFWFQWYLMKVHHFVKIIQVWPIRTSYNWSVNHALKWQLFEINWKRILLRKRSIIFKASGIMMLVFFDESSSTGVKVVNFMTHEPCITFHGLGWMTIRKFWTRSCSFSGDALNPYLLLTTKTVLKSGFRVQAFWGTW